MIVLSFKTKKDKEHLLEKAKRMEAYITELVDCLEEAHHEEPEHYQERRYHYEEPVCHEYREPHGRYDFRRGMR